MAARAQSLVAVELPSGDAVEVDATSEDEASLVIASMPITLERVPREERPGLPERIEAAYARMHARMGPQPSVWMESLHGTPRALFADTETDRAVIFLHGSGGGFTWPCALVAEVAARTGASTLCPSLDANAAWNGAAGRAVVDDAIAMVRRRGATHVVLAGLSSGAVGASRLAAHLGDRIDGLVLLSGAARGARAAQPTLLIHGAHDHMLPVGGARAFARRSPHAELHVLEGDHFVLAARTDEVAALLEPFLRARFTSAGAAGAPGPPPDRPGGARAAGPRRRTP
jgi:pimeloyl-ACP methyl ester carboxylesterase